MPRHLSSRTLVCASDQAAVMTPTVRSMTAVNCMREYLFPQMLPAIMVVMLPPDLRMMCTGTEMS